MKQQYYGPEFDNLIKAKFTNEDLIKINEFNALKYIYRWRNKNGIEDLKKCTWYINEIIRIIEQEN